jgi:hypothetical protein
MEADAVCAVECASDADCAPVDRCVALVTAEGRAVSACVARDGRCGKVPAAETGEDGGTGDAGSGDGGTSSCPRYAAPETSGTCCVACSASSSSCQPNRCFGGWLCDTLACRCIAPTTPCEQSGDALHAGGAVTADLTPAQGGTASRLHFAVVGDTRPALPDDTAHYPSATIRSIYEGIAAADPHPSFVVATGDYVFAKPESGEGAKQLDLYTAARAPFAGPFWPAYGNHECTGYTASNCGTGIGSGEVGNYRAYVEKFLAPISETRPYFARRIAAPDASWTAKLVFVAPNSWDAAQESWLETQLAAATTYTFLVRHEPSYADTAPGVVPSDAVAARHPVTLFIEGHTHSWQHRYGSRELIVGNGGAPLTSAGVYGFTVISQREGGDLVVSSYDHATRQPVTTFIVHADGTPAP